MLCDMWLLFEVIVFGVCFVLGQNDTKERTASLVVLPPLVLGYNELYDDSETSEDRKPIDNSQEMNNSTEHVTVKESNVNETDRKEAKESLRHSMPNIKEANQDGERIENKLQRDRIQPMLVFNEHQSPTVPSSIGSYGINVNRKENQIFNSRMVKPVPFVGGLIFPNVNDDDSVKI